MSNRKSFFETDGERERERDGMGCCRVEFVTMMGRCCVGKCDETAASEIERLMTHPIFLIYELGFEQEVWVSRHHHHVL